MENSEHKNNDVVLVSILLLLLSAVVIMYGCKKNEPENGDTWTEEDWTEYRSILTLQKEAGQKWEEYIVSMDTATAMESLKSFFLENPNVEDVQVTEVGISVMYTNGIVGGILINPKRKDLSRQGFHSGNNYRNPEIPYKCVGIKKHKALLISPYYWDKEAMSSDSIHVYYNTLFPKVGLQWEAYYKHEEVTVELFTKLSGYRLIHIDTHGDKHFYFTKTPPIELCAESYMLTGEVVNDATTTKYHKDLNSKKMGVWLMKSPSGGRENFYSLTGNFVMDHNDFSRDSVLIIGGFCYSLVEAAAEDDPKPTSSWSRLPFKCASGVFVGFTFPVGNLWFQRRIFSLMDSLCDTIKTTPCSISRWFDLTTFDKCVDYSNENCMKYYGDKAFALWAQKARIETRPISDITKTAAKSGGNIVSDGGTPIQTRGVCWNTTGQPTTADKKTTDGSGTGMFTSQITGLQAKTKYYVRAYVTDQKGKIVYGNQLDFKTLGDSVSVVTAPVTEITMTSAVSGGTITAESGTSIEARGLCYGITPEPTLAGTSTYAGTGTGTFSSMMGFLTENTKYYVRAYATDQDDSTYYGDEVFFTTASSGYYVGQHYGGGVIFYIDGTGQHGLITDQYDVQNAPWGCEDTFLGGTSTAFGSGQANSLAILAACAESNIAVRKCDELVREDFDDWYLPSLDEFSYLWNTHVVTFWTANQYETSSEVNTTQNWTYSGMGSYPVSKFAPYQIRCIRSF